MKTNIFKQAVYDMRHQPVLGVVTVIGTALSIFLIMTVVMMHRCDVMPLAPESNRDLLLYGRHLHIKGEKMESSSQLNHNLARRLYGDIKGSTTTVMTNDAETVDLTVPGRPAMLAYRHATDDKFWRVFDYRFIAGRPYDEAAFKAGSREVVLCESVARKMFGSTDIIGREICVRQIPFRVVGVVEDASPLAKTAFAELFYPYTVNNANEVTSDDENFGDMQAIILADKASDMDRIRHEARSRIQVFANELLKTQGDSLIDHGQPFTHEEALSVWGSNGDISVDEQRRSRYIIYLIFLLIPAINLSSMTQSRLRRRTGEIGVRRAFGCTRGKLMLDIVAENFLTTLAGSIIGLILCLFFGYFFGEYIFSDLEVERSARISIDLLFDWKLYGAVIFFSFLLNLISSGVPAWRASRIPPVDAINSKNI